jgi:hypothetical protein
MLKRINDPGWEWLGGSLALPGQQLQKDGLSPIGWDKQMKPSCRPSFLQV